MTQATVEGILDHAPARRWLDLLDRTVVDDLYTYQRPLTGRSGPRVEVDGREMLMLSAYDYLGLIGHPEVEAAAIAAVRTHGTGSGGVRLLTGTLTLHRELEERIARFKGTERALVFTSGYLAALGAIAALVGPRDLVLADEAAHRSTLEGCRLAGCTLRRFRHDDPGSLERELRRAGRGRRVLIVVEGLYSMDGDICALPAIVELKERHGALLMVDEAHSFGTLGATGRGVDEHHGVATEAVELWMGSLSKALPASGGFLAGSRRLVSYLEHGAAPFMFSAALCPAAAGAGLGALEVLAREPERPAAARRNGATLREGLRRLGLDPGPSEGPVVPVLLGDETRTLQVARELEELGVLASAVIHPAVPRGRARLRLCATAAQAGPDLEAALAALETAVLRTSGCPSVPV
jgi:8-amino-7-oxononanoate synthase